MKFTLTDRRNLGDSGLRVSPLCLGTMMFGGATDATESRKIIDHAFEQGCNFIDTADVYNLGESEKIVGEAIASNRDRWVLASKVGNAMGDDVHQRGHNRKWMMKALDDSLKRLDTDYLDIWYLHYPDDFTRLEEVVETLGLVMSSGKVLHWGVSNYRGWQIAEFVRLAEQAGVPRPSICQPYYNALNRMPEVEVLPACARYGLGVAPYSPIARGILTGKYQAGKAPDPSTRAGRKDTRMMETEFREESMKIAETLGQHAQAKGMPLLAFALLWLLNNQIVTSPIAGPRTFEQWVDYVNAMSHEFTHEDEALLDSLVPIGHPSTPGYNDPRYPITGRPCYV